ncbi:heavy metal-responsive transcriptional regulator [Actinomadura soli]|uniref:Heavy metal-responsive transcriptional regulator n=1 Tax=Actinomadura soli TaxID=2508997 RepID=A0A5C4IYK3_9ACTN|nr:heavy metal-responsive transcriptional regulator [Actinomadura soli]TMQ81731.1 heavy metal-responsive transcriptional regulator [Actinomadura soli]
MRIGVFAAQAGLTAKTIRFYEQAGLLPAPPRTSSGYRDYPPEALARLAFIRDAQSAGLTLSEIRSILTIRDSGQPPCRHVAELIDRHLTQVEERILELAQARAALTDLKHRAASTDPANCDDTAICTILTR